MTPAHARDLIGGRTVGHPRGAHDRSDALRVQRPERQDLDPTQLAALDGPFQHRGLPAGEHHSYGGTESRKQFVSQPRVGQTVDLVGVDEQDSGGTGIW